MGKYIINEIRKGDNTYVWDYESLANLPDSFVSEGTGITVTHDSTTNLDQVSLSDDFLGKIDTIYDAVFPVTAVLKSTSGTGTFSIGTTVTPVFNWELTNVKPETRVITEKSVSGGGWTELEEIGTSSTTYSFPETTEGASYRIRVITGNSEIIIGPKTVGFALYRYYGELPAVPAEITEDLVKGLASKDLVSGATKENISVGAGKYFLFAAPSEWTAKVYHKETGGEVTGEELKTGTVMVGEDLYTWLLVPSSSMKWSFNIIKQ